MNIPNALTMMRIIFVPVIIILLMQGSYTKALILFVLSGITDGLDGFLARFLNQQTTLGAYLDPIADKALIMSCFITLSIKQVVPGWLTVIVISRDCIILVGISVLVLMSVHFEVRPSVVSKITTLFQLLTVFVALLARSIIIPPSQGWILYLVFGLTALFTAISGFHYLFRGIRLMNRAT
ncbi:MAG: CDP-alcohol phosphatidyltransferase family protein [Syntrophales bacterium]|nr:CDP-alcohol phosphatidyltransferase family protein [Syntrophales bacterium]